MSTEIPERGRLTDLLVLYFREHPDITGFPLLVGDGDVPDAAGWPGGNAEQGAFVASTTVRTQPAVSLHRESVRSRHSSWRCRYGIKTIGAVRHQADAAADVVRQSVLAFKETRLVHGPPEDLKAWEVQDVVFESLGGVNKQGSGDTATFDVEDVVDIWLVRAAP